MIQIHSAPYAGTAYLNSVAQSGGHNFKLYLGTNLKEIFFEIDSFKPDIIGFSCMSNLYSDILSVAGEIKKKSNVPIILGGPHATLFPEIINNDCIDIICRGEGEFAFLDLLDALDKKAPYNQIENLWVKENGQIYKNNVRPLVDDLDKIPLIDWSCYKGTEVENSPPIAFLVRGCPYSCSYCFNETTRSIYKGLGKYVRHFSVERSIDEIKQALKVFSYSPVLFTSDSFGMNHEWMEQLFAKYSEITDLPFVLLLRPELATEKCVKIISKYNCYSVAIGVESGSERVRKEILNRNHSNNFLLEIADRLHSSKIKFRTYNMIGLPTETEQEIWETININIKMKTDFPRGAIFTPLPNTKIVEIAKERGYLDNDFSFETLPSTILSNSILKKVNKDLIKNYLYFFQTAILFQGSHKLIKRLINFKPNIIYRLWFYLVYLYLHRKSEKRRLLPYIRYVFANRRYK